MKILVNENEKLKRKFLKYILKMPPEQFFGITTILGVKIKNEDLEEKATAPETTENTLTAENLDKLIDTIQTTTTTNTLKEPLVIKGEDLATTDEVLYINENEDNMESAPDGKENSEEEKDTTKDALSILYECLEKFEALSINQKKNLLKIIKAGA